ncbi:MAG: serine/threonine-protein kinase [Chitinophagaceae bacterium]|nr:serine/threonine-protein kinase [Chitinophagaceae bacterium]
MLLFDRYDYNPRTDLIGKGSNSKVYKALDTNTDRSVALKIYKATEDSDRFGSATELARVKALHHPNICSYICIDAIEKENSFGETEKSQVCVMEIAEAGNLGKYFQVNKDFTVLKKLLIDTVAGLQYLHDNSIVHLGIKPSNILIHKSAEGPVAQIADFGITNPSDPGNSTSSALIVSIPYMAPEQLNTQKYGINGKVSFNIDIWTLGVTVFETITGDVLFKAQDRDSSEQVMTNIISAALPEKINQLPQPFRDFVHKCLVKDAKERAASPADLLSILRVGTDAPLIVAPVLAETPSLDDASANSNADDTMVLSKSKVGVDLNKPVEKAEESTDDTRVLSRAPVSEGSDDTRVLSKADLPGQKANEPALVKAEPGSDDTMILPSKAAAAMAQEQEDEDATRILKRPPLQEEDSIAMQPTPQRRESAVLLFNRYEYYPTSHMIGKGGFSRVYKAFDKKLSRWVALKIYKTGEFSDRYSPIAEIQRVVNLDHPNICRYLDIEEIEKENQFGENEKIQVCVMELLESGNFAEYYKKSKDLEVLKKLLQDVLNGLSYLHKNGIIHRDIKPANILIKSTIDGPVAKITDFGISKKSDSENNSSSALVVSIPYMAPEQLNTKKYGVNEKITFNLDLWSLGVTVYEIITEKVLFKNSDQDTSEQIMANIMAPDLPNKIEELPQPFKSIVAYCVTKNANERAQKAEELMVLLNSSNIDENYKIPERTEKANATNTGTGTSGERSTGSAINTGRSQGAVRSGNGRNNEGTASSHNSGKDTKKQLAVKLLAVLGSMALLTMILIFFFKPNKSATILQNVKDSGTVRNKAAVAKPDISTSVQASLPEEARDSSHRSSDTLSKERIAPPANASTAATSAATTEKKKNTAERKEELKKQEEPVVKNKGNQKYVLELSTGKACSIKINSTDYGELNPGEIMKAYLTPGKYVLKAINLQNSASVYSANLEVTPENSNQVGRFKIPL